MKRALSCAALVLAAVGTASAVGPGYYRSPALNGRTLVFTAEGDLWKVPTEGGMAQRLTTHPGMESNAALSPDGRTIAFSASYEGPTEVYTMPVSGGLPRRRTWHGGDAIVVGYTPSGRILYASTSGSTLPDTKLATIHPESGAIEPIPLAQAADGSYDASGSTLFFTRLAFQGSHTKRYRGGTAQKIWKLEEGVLEAVPLTAGYDGTSRSPMAWEGRVYFVSDRDGTMNLWSMDEKGGDLRQHTRHSGWDVASPSLSEGRIAYRLGADLRIHEIVSGQDAVVDIELASDLDQTRERWVRKPMSYLTSAHVSPDGDRVVLTARGQVFVAPARQGRLVEATRREGVRYRDARFLDARTLAVLSDESGEVEWWALPASGVGDGEALTSDGKVLRFEGVPSPDGRRIAYHDRDQDLWILDRTTRKNTRIATCRAGRFRDLAWSPDGAWLAYVAPADNGISRIHLHRVEDGTTCPLTSDRAPSASPAWSPDGKRIYFLSDRELKSIVRSPWGNRQPEPFFDRPTRIYVASLVEGERSPFEPANELLPKPEEKSPEEGTAKGEDPKEGASGKDAKKPPAVRIDLEGLERRIETVPVPADSYESLTVTDKRIFFVVREISLERKGHLCWIEITREDPKPKTLLSDVRGYELSASGKKILVRKVDDLFLLDSSSGEKPDLADRKVPLEDWAFSLDPREEWRQMFREAWRLERDYFYDPGMHGVDWNAVRLKYEPLVDRVTDRAELSDLIAQMVSELSALHIFVRGGDRREPPDRVEIATLGADLVRDDALGGYRVRRIWRSDPDYPNDLSPLAKPSVAASEGDVLTAIDGVALSTVPDPGVLLRNRAGKQALLTLREAKTGRTRDAVAVPISAERDADLRYDDWEQSRRLLVEEAGAGEIGYVHLRAMGADDYSAFARDFYPVYRRKGLIVDVRHNRGGNIDSWVLEKLMRRAWFFWQPRVGLPYWNMQYAFRGPMVVITDEWTASDGEAFAEGFRRLGLGKVIGTRTWGGEIWLSASNFLVDHGIATAAETGVFGPEGEWLIEGWGVEPDVVVDNFPRETFDGRDAQLEAAIRHLQERIAEEPVQDPKAPEYPDRSGF